MFIIMAKIANKIMRSGKNATRFSIESEIANASIPHMHNNAIKRLSSVELELDVDLF